MTRKALSFIAASLLGVLAAAPAMSQQTQQPAQQSALCGVRTEIISKLSKDFKEAPMAVGMVDQTNVLEIFVSDLGTWTILATRPDGTSCIVSAGEGWDSKTLITGRDA
jgi:hypothetical protein